MDDFHFGQPGRRGPRAGLDRVLMAVGALLVAGLAVIGFMMFVSRGGEEVAEAQVSAVRQVDVAGDREAQTTLRTALVAAKTAFTDSGSYEGVTAADLASMHPSLTFTDGPSPNDVTVSVAFTVDGFGAAAMSSSGTCFIVSDHVATGITYGTADPAGCTGQAGLGATAPSW